MHITLNERDSRTLKKFLKENRLQKKRRICEANQRFRNRRRIDEKKERFEEIDWDGDYEELEKNSDKYLMYPEDVELTDHLTLDVLRGDMLEWAYKTGDYNTRSHDYNRLIKKFLRYYAKMFESLANDSVFITKFKKFNQAHDFYEVHA